MASSESTSTHRVPAQEHMLHSLQLKILSETLWSSSWAEKLSSSRAARPCDQGNPRISAHTGRESPFISWQSHCPPARHCSRSGEFPNSRTRKQAGIPRPSSDDMMDRSADACPAKRDFRLGSTETNRYSWPQFSHLTWANPLYLAAGFCIFGHFERSVYFN